MSEKIFYPSKQDYQDLENFICGSKEQSQCPYAPYPPPNYPYVPPTYPTTEPWIIYKTTDNTGTVTSIHDYGTSVSTFGPTKETVYPNGDKFIFYA